MFYLVFLYLPVLLLPLFSFNDGTIVAFPIKGWTLEWYRQLGGRTRSFRRWPTA